MAEVASGEAAAAATESAAHVSFAPTAEFNVVTPIDPRDPINAGASWGGRCTLVDPELLKVLLG